MTDVTDTDNNEKNLYVSAHQVLFHTLSFRVA